MKLNSITFDDSNPVSPSTVSVTMPIEEALWIAVVSGKATYCEYQHSIYDCLVGDVFNRYWEDGTDEALKELQVEVCR